MATAFVQTNESHHGTGAVATAVVVLTGVVAGNTIIASCGWFHRAGGDETMTFADDKGNTYTQYDHAYDATNLTPMSVFVAPVVTGGTVTITGTFVASGREFFSCVIHEVSGVDTTTPVNGHAAVVSASTATPSVGPITTTVDGCYVFSHIYIQVLPSAAATAGTGFTRRSSVVDAASIAEASEDQVQSAQGSISGTWTLPEAHVNSLTMVALRPPSAAVPSIKVVDFAVDRAANY